MPKRLLELFSGTHSIGRVAKNKNYEVVSLDRDLGAKSKLYNYTSPTHIQEDIMTWDYTIYPPHHFEVITASPVCLYWSNLLCCNFGRELKRHPGVPFSRELMDKDIEEIGKPMVDKVREIIDYFKPKWWWIENPKTGRMKGYITDLPFYDVDYCKYSNWGYKKSTRFWTNIKGFEPKLCKKDCENMMDEGKHNLRISKREKHKKEVSDNGGGSNKLMRYRIPEKLIEELLDLCI